MDAQQERDKPVTTKIWKERKQLPSKKGDNAQIFSDDEAANIKSRVNINVPSKECCPASGRFNLGTSYCYE